MFARGARSAVGAAIVPVAVVAGLAEIALIEGAVITVDVDLTLNMLHNGCLIVMTGAGGLFHSKAMR